jgi:hypothetical protein
LAVMAMANECIIGGREFAAWLPTRAGRRRQPLATACMRRRVLRCEPTVSAEWSQVTFVPVSGLHGDNVVKPSPNMAWYKGPTLLQAIDKLEPLKPPANSQPLRFTVQDVIDVPEVGTVAIGYAPFSALTAWPLPYTAVA